MKTCVTLCVASALLALAAPAGADWPRFRGPTGDGVSAEKGLPLTWGPKENVLWKTKLPGPGSSSPIVLGDRVFVTCYTGHGVTRADTADVTKLRRHLLCLDRATGKVLWDRSVEALQREVAFRGNITEHGYATHTPVTDGERVYVYYGRSGAYAYDLDGKELWHTETGKILNSWGSAASPVLWGDLLILNAAIEADALVALDRKTGKQVWRFKGVRDCWSTPIIVDVPGGKQELVLSTAAYLMGFDPAKGEKLWECESIATGTASSTPVARNGIVYIMGTGFEGRGVLAIKAGGKGDVTKTHTLWRQPKAGASHCSLLPVGDRLYYIAGQAVCLDAKTGDFVYQQRLYDGKGEYASPVLADGKIYLFSRRSGGYVVAPGDKLQVLARNDLGDASDFNATPAVSHGCLLVRSNQYLYCIAGGVLQRQDS